MDYEFDAPQYFDFGNADAYEKVYNDTWFDQRELHFLVVFNKHNNFFQIWVNNHKLTSLT